MTNLIVDLILFMLAGAAFGALVRYIRYLNRPRTLTPAWSVPLYLVGGAAGGAVFFFTAQRFGWTAPHLDWILVAALGGAVGVGELASRYRDEPIKAILSIPATVYVLLNATAAILALVLSRHFELWTTTEEPVSWSQVLAAGLGAMVLLRSSVFRIKMGNQDVAVGPSSFLQSIIDAADRAVDRVRAQERAWAVAHVMEGVCSEKAMVILPPYISALMQNPNPEEQGRFEERVEKLRNGQESGCVKALTLGLLAMNHAGLGVLRAAVQSLATEICASAEQTFDAAKEAAAMAHDTKAATEELKSAVEKVAAVTHTTGTPSEAARAIEEARATAVVAGTAAQETLDQAQRTADAAKGTAETAAAAARAIEAERNPTAAAVTAGHTKPAVKRILKSNQNVKAAAVTARDTKSAINSVASPNDITVSAK
jgi:hypothetical protein